MKPMDLSNLNQNLPPEREHGPPPSRVWRWFLLFLILVIGLVVLAWHGYLTLPWLKAVFPY